MAVILTYVKNVVEVVSVSMAGISASVRTVKVAIYVSMVAEREYVKSVADPVSASMAFRNIGVRYVHLDTLMSLHGRKMLL
jgi:hypothetical protein